MQPVYLDNAASTRPMSAVSDAFDHVNENYYANPSAAHSMGIEAEKLVDLSRNMIARSIGARPDEIIFTSGGTESINLAVRGLYGAHSKKRNRIITAQTEHAATYETVRSLKEEGADVRFIKIDAHGLPDLGSLMKLIDKNTLLVTLSHVNNESGTINPVEEICRIVKSFDREIYIHIDAVQSFCKMDVKDAVRKSDLMSFSAHKIHGPKGIGFLYCRKGTRLRPEITGGGQEHGLRSGTLDLPLIYSFAKAVSTIDKTYVSNSESVLRIKEHLIGLLGASGLGYVLNFPVNTSPYILNVSFPGIKSEILMHHLEERGIIVSAGSACSSRQKKNRVLKAFGISDENADSAIRISFSKDTTREETQLFFDTLCEVMTKLKT